MKMTIKYDKGASMHRVLSFAIIRASFILVVWCAGMIGTVQAQAVEYTRPLWWFGLAGGANFNFYDGSTQKLNNQFTAPVAFDEAQGVSLYLAPLVEYHFPGTGLGIMFQVGYDNRSSSYTTQTTPCNCPADLTTSLSYVTVEPSLRVAPFKGNFYLYGGPRFAFNVDKSFTYELGINPDFPDQEPTPDVKGDFSNVKSSLLSMQVGAGYDIPLSSRANQAQFVLSPFVSFHPYFGQSPRDIETWTVTTVRAGAAIKFGHGRLVRQPDVIEVMPVEPDVRFTINSPRNVQAEPDYNETFPLRNYVFFDPGSTEIPERYVRIRKQDVMDFREDELDMHKPANLSGRADRQMIVYYNVINILGERMVKDPSSAVTLVGSSEKGPDDGREMALSIRQYLVDIFGIDLSRITVEGRDKPKIPSEQPGGVLELDLLRAGDRRVSIESNTPALLMEFYNGPTAPLKPVQIKALREAPPSSYVSFDAQGAKKNLSSWSLEVKDEKGVIQNFGPYTDDKISLPGNTILGSRPEGDYKVTMIGKTKDGRVVRREVPVHVVRWAPSTDKEGMRYSILYEFNESKAITMYEKYLTEIVAPKIPIGGKVLVRGYTDIIGDEANNLRLSQARAEDVKKILEASLAKAGRTDANIEVKAFGEDPEQALFGNTFPEERFYNRTVVIDILPMKK